MKALAILLSLMVFVLNAVPCCWDACTENNPVEHSEPEAGSEDACSPFLSCGSCAGFVQQQNPTNFSSIDYPYQLLVEQIEPGFQSTYAIKIWQPPRFL